MGIRRFFKPFESAREEMEEYINSLPEDQEPVARQALELFFPVSEAEKGVLGGIYITAGTDKINISVPQLKELVSNYTELNTDEQRIIFVKAVPLFVNRLKTVHYAYHKEEGLPIEHRFQIAKLFAELSTKMAEAIKLTILVNFLWEEAQRSETVTSTFIEPITGVAVTRRSARSHLNLIGISTLRMLRNEDLHVALISSNRNEISANFRTSRGNLNDEQREKVDLWAEFLSYESGSQLFAARELIELHSPTA
jgi:hypothetical protein